MSQCKKGRATQETINLDAKKNVNKKYQILFVNCFVIRKSILRRLSSAKINGSVNAVFCLLQYYASYNSLKGGGIIATMFGSLRHLSCGHHAVWNKPSIYCI